MSSWIGHGIAAVTVYVSDKGVKRNRSEVFWALWLVVVAIAPDVDYVLAFLRVGEEQARLTHSIVGAALLPVLTIVAGLLYGWRGKLLLTRALQVLAAGLSHLVLDLLVGVHPMPLFFPLTLTLYKLPFGILPSAPLARLDNPLLYRNLFIEFGALAPLPIILFLLRRPAMFPSFRRFAIPLLGLCALAFMAWAFTLSRA